MSAPARATSAELTRRPTERVKVTRVTGPEGDREAHVRPDDLIVEEPLSIQLDGSLVSTTMRTPGHDHELAVGFCFTEGLFGGAEVLGVRHCSDETTAASVSNVVTVDTGALAPVPTPRLGNASSSCGWCGSQHLDELCARLEPLPDGGPVDLDVIGSIVDAVVDGQGLFASTGSVHAAAAFDSSGAVLLTREDVGRHNAVDKVVGALVLERNAPSRDRSWVVRERSGKHRDGAEGVGSWLLNAGFGERSDGVGSRCGPPGQPCTRWIRAWRWL